MKICFPAQKDDGLNSTVYNHFGSAPLFVVVDTETNGLATINNQDLHHSHGSCNPMKALDNQKIDAIVVGVGSGGTLTVGAPEVVEGLEFTELCYLDPTVNQPLIPHEPSDAPEPLTEP
jgi:hypothetical protein